MSYSTIVVTGSAAMRAVVLNRPEHRNAMTPEMQQELIAAMQEAVADGSRALVLRGAGNAFCSGLDLSALQAIQHISMAEYRASVELTAKLFRTLYELPMPTIAVVDGAAMAGGAGLAMMCDFTLASSSARFGLTEVRIGFIPALVSVFLALQMGEKQLRDLVLTGRICDAEEALRMGLVNEVVPSDKLEVRTQSLVDTLTACSAQAQRAAKRLIARRNRAWLDAAIQQAIEASVQARETADFREGVAAFIEKRKPHWPQ